MSASSSGFQELDFSERAVAGDGLDGSSGALKGDFYNGGATGVGKRRSNMVGSDAARQQLTIENETRSLSAPKGIKFPATYREVQVQS